MGATLHRYATDEKCKRFHLSMRKLSWFEPLAFTIFNRLGYLPNMSENVHLISCLQFSTLLLPVPIAKKTANINHFLVYAQLS